MPNNLHFTSLFVAVVDIPLLETNESIRMFSCNRIWSRYDHNHNYMRPDIEIIEYQNPATLKDMWLSF
jgi:hypothetical protein